VQEGCLTERQTQLHSCEQGTGCEVFKKGKSALHNSGQIN
jgi:hypothetical protein